MSVFQTKPQTQTETETQCYDSDAQSKEDLAPTRAGRLGRMLFECRGLRGSWTTRHGEGQSRGSINVRSDSGASVKIDERNYSKWAQCGGGKSTEAFDAADLSTERMKVCSLCEPIKPEMAGMHRHALSDVEMV